MEFVTEAGRHSRRMEREGQTQGVSNWKSGGFCLWAWLKQIWKQSIKWLSYYQRGILSSTMIKEWMISLDFMWYLTVIKTLTSSTDNHIVLAFAVLFWKSCFEIKWKTYWQLPAGGSHLLPATSLHFTPCPVSTMTRIRARCELSEGYNEMRIPALIPQHPTMGKISRAQVWDASASRDIVFICSRRAF